MMATVHSSTVKKSFGANPEARPGLFCCPASHHEVMMMSYDVLPISSPARRKKTLLAFTLEFSNQLVAFKIVWTVASGTSDSSRLTSAWKWGPVCVAFQDGVPMAPRSCDNLFRFRGTFVWLCRCRVMWISSIINPLGDRGLL